MSPRNRSRIKSPNPGIPPAPSPEPVETAADVPQVESLESRLPMPTIRMFHLERVLCDLVDADEIDGILEEPVAEAVSVTPEHAPSGADQPCDQTEMVSLDEIEDDQPTRTDDVSRPGVACARISSLPGALR